MASSPTQLRLSRERVVDAALELVDRDGWEALSMRKLAQELDVWPMAVYRYFRDKDELMDALVDAAAEEVVLPTGQGSWRSQIRDLLREARGALRRHPVGPRVSARRAFMTPAGLRLSEVGLRLLEEAGFEGPEAVRVWQVLFGYTMGFAGFAGTDDPEAAGDTRSAIAALGKADYPSLTAIAEELAAPGDDQEQFDYGLERLLDGLEARLAAKASA